jgi:hypothetical protein
MRETGRVVRNRRGDIDVERSSLDVVLRAEAGPPPRDCDSCPQDVAIFLDRSRHRWDCPRHPRHDADR